MPDAGTNVQPAGTETGEDLAPEFTYEELLGEVAAFIGRPPREPGDVDKKQIAAKYGVSLKATETIMARAEKSGKWIKLLVFDPECRHDVLVIRKKS